LARTLSFHSQQHQRISQQHPGTDRASAKNNPIYSSLHTAGAPVLLASNNNKTKQMKRQVSEPINVLCLTNDKQTHKQKARLCHTDMSPSASANLHRPPAANNTTTKLNITAVRLHVVYTSLTGGQRYH